MKAISIQWPWSWAILEAGKDVENRTWATAFRGRVLVHTGKTIDREALHWLRTQGYRVPESAPLGCVLGSVEIADCVEASSSFWFGGPYGLVLREPRTCSVPIPCRGALGFFAVPAEVEAAVRRAVEGF
jgi:hypothetical protein